MNICFLEGDMSRKGGTERMTALLANELSDIHDISIISLHMRDEKVFFDLNGKIKLIVLSKALNSTGIIKQIWKIRKYLIHEKIDWVINVDIGMGLYGILSAKGMKTKVITWEHSNYYNNWNSKIFPYLRKMAAKHSDMLVVLTNQDKMNYLKNIKGIKKICVIANPVEKHEIEYSLESKIILSAGLLTPIKGFNKAIKVAKKVLGKHPDWKWIICGDGPEYENLRKMIEAGRLQSKVILAGTVTNMEMQYKNTAIYVMTSEMEGLPMVLLEAKSWGVPIVSFDIMTGPRDIIEDQKNGYLVQNQDIEDMSDKINLLIEDDLLRKQFSDNSQRGMEQYDIELIRKQWDSIFNRKGEN